MLHETTTQVIIAAFYAVHDRLGFGFLESVYRNALANELMRRGLKAEREVCIEVWDLGLCVGHFRADKLVQRVVLVEVKAAKSIGEADRKQVLNYLRASDKEVELLMNFGEKPSFERFIYTNDRKPRSTD